MMQRKLYSGEYLALVARAQQSRPTIALPLPAAACRPGRPGGNKQLSSRQPRRPLAQTVCAVVVQSDMQAMADGIAIVSLEVSGQSLQFGEQLKAVGEAEALGRWVLDEAPLFKWAVGDDWLLEAAATR